MSHVTQETTENFFDHLSLLRGEMNLDIQMFNNSKNYDDIPGAEGR